MLKLWEKVNRENIPKTNTKKPPTQTTNVFRMSSSSVGSLARKLQDTLRRWADYTNSVSLNIEEKERRNREKAFKQDSQKPANHYRSRLV